MKRSILHLIRILDPATGGPVEYLKQLAAVHTHMGVEVGILTLDRSDPGWLRDLAATVIECGPGRGTYGFDPQLKAKLTELAGAFEAMVVHGLWQYHGLCASRVAAKLGTPYYVFPHGMLDPWFKKSYPLKHLKKQLYWTLAERKVLEQARAVLFTTEKEARLAESTFWPKGNYRPRILPLGVPPAPSDTGAVRDAFLQKFPHLRNRRFLLFLGRLHPKKGCDFLVKAFAEIRPPVDLVLAGPGANPQYTAELKRFAEDLPITFTDLIGGAVKSGALACAEALILPSHQENFGLVVAEALSFGTPVLLSEQVNISEEVKLFGAGFVEPDTLAGTRRLIERWLEHGNPAMRVAALNCFHHRFNIEQSAQKLLEIIKTKGSEDETKGSEENLNRR
jgi:glycosyltransferase involved in cell wall biosynthesis